MTTMIMSFSIGNDVCELALIKVLFDGNACRRRLVP
jgi:hypothetical protein